MAPPEPPRLCQDEDGLLGGLGTSAKSSGAERAAEREPPGKHRTVHTWPFPSSFYYENKTNAPGEGSMITRNIRVLSTIFILWC